MIKILNFLRSLILIVFLFYLLKLMFFDAARPIFREFILHPSCKTFLNYITDPGTIAIGVLFIINTWIIIPFIINFGIESDDDMD